MKGKGLVLYNVVDDSEEGIVIEEGDVRVNVFMPGKEKIVMKSNVSIDGGKVFKTKMDINPYRCAPAPSPPCRPRRGAVVPSDRCPPPQPVKRIRLRK